MNALVLLSAASDLLIGSTILLGSGVAVAAVARAPVHRQRAAELAVFATVVWLALAVVPLPRWEWRAPDRDAGANRTAGSEPAGAARSGNAEPTPSTPALTEPDPSLPTAAGDRLTDRANDRRTGRDVQAPPMRWPRLLGLVYAVGSAIATAYLALGLVLVRQLLWRSIAPPEWLEILFMERRHALGVRRVRLRVTRARCRPLSAGVFRPTVILPVVLVERARIDAIRRVLDHELVHIRRRDVLGRLLFACAAPLLRPHPLFWWLRARAALAAELIADDGASSCDGRRAYARGLLALSQELQPLRTPPGLAPGTFRTRSELTRRIEMLTQSHSQLAAACSGRRNIVQATAAALAIGICAGAFGVQPLPAQNPDVAVKAEQDPVRGNAAARQNVERADAPADPPVDAQSAAPTDGPSAATTDAPTAAPPAVPARASTAASNNAPTTAPSAAPASVPSDSRQQSPRQRPDGPAQLPGPDPAYAATLALVNQALTLRGEVELALANLSRSNNMREQQVITDEDYRKAAVETQTLQRRFEAIMILVQAEIEATQIELGQIEQGISLGTAPQSAAAARVRLAARLRVLESVL